MIVSRWAGVTALALVIAGATAGAAAQAGRKACFGVVPANSSARALQAGGIPLVFGYTITWRRFQAVLEPDRPLDRVRIRLGPAASGAFKAPLACKPLPVEPCNAGDARWLWPTLEHLPPGKHHIPVSLPAASRP